MSAVQDIVLTIVGPMFRETFEKVKPIIYDEVNKKFPQVAQITSIVKDMGSLNELLPKAKEAVVTEVNKAIDVQLKKYNEDVGKIIDERIKAAVAGLPVAPATEGNAGNANYNDPSAYENYNTGYANEEANTGYGNQEYNNQGYTEEEDPSAGNNSGWFGGGSRRRRRHPRRHRKISRKGIKGMPAERRGTRRANKRRASRRNRRSTRRNMRK